MPHRLGYRHIRRGDIKVSSAIIIKKTPGHTCVNTSGVLPSPFFSHVRPRGDRQMTFPRDDTRKLAPQDQGRREGGWLTIVSRSLKPEHHGWGDGKIEMSPTSMVS